MRRRPAAHVPALLAILAALGARSALGAERACPAMTVEADARLRDRWPAWPEQIRAAFATRDDVDVCATVTLTFTDAGVGVQVALPDGRTASRSVARREDVLPTLEALLLVPAHEETIAAAVATPAPPPAQAPAPRREDVRTEGAHGDGRAPASPLANEPGRLRVEFSVATSARVGDGQKGFGLGVLSFLDLGGWLMGFEGRADSYQDLGVGGPPIAALELAVLGGRRFRFGTLALDLAAGPALAVQGIGGGSETTVVKTTADAPAGRLPMPPPSGGTEPRLLLATRLGFRSGSVLRPFVGVDGELGRARGRSDVELIAEGHLPAWTVGVALGATVGTP
jgi:hypothetical protein